MGLTQSRNVYISNYFVPNDTRPGQGIQAQRDFARLKLDKLTVDRLYDTFVKFDKDGTALVDLDEFYRYTLIERTPFVDRAFLVFDEGGDGVLDFREFVLSMWNYATLDLKNLLQFAFAMYDLDQSGFVEIEEVKAMLGEVYGAHLNLNARLLPLFDELDNNDDGRISLQEFKQFFNDYPSLLFPAFKVQLQLREVVLGHDFWEEAMQERLKLGTVANECLFELMRVVDEQRRRADKTMMQEMSRMRWVPTDLPEGTYIPTPSLSFKARNNHKMAQRECLIRAGVIKVDDDPSRIAAIKGDVDASGKGEEDREKKASDDAAKAERMRKVQAKATVKLDRSEDAKGRNARKANALRKKAAEGRNRRGQLDNELNRALTRLRRR